jgi:hypothetical protein
MGAGRSSRMYDKHAIDTAFSTIDAMEGAIACQILYPKTDLKYYVEFTDYIKMKIKNLKEKETSMSDMFKPLPIIEVKAFKRECSDELFETREEAIYAERYYKLAELLPYSSKDPLTWPTILNKLDDIVKLKEIN